MIASITPETLQIYIWGGLLAFVCLGAFIYSELSKAKCQWCHKECNKFDDTTVKENRKMFCSHECYLQYKERTADVAHKEKIAGKGNVNTNINEYKVR